MATNKLPDRSHFGFHRKNYFNQAIHLYAQTHENVHVIDLWDKPQFFKEGQLGNFREIREELFIEDKIHPSQEGYDLLRDIFREALKDIL